MTTMRDELQCNALGSFGVGTGFSSFAAPILVKGVQWDDPTVIFFGGVFGVAAALAFLTALVFWIASFCHERNPEDKGGLAVATGVLWGGDITADKSFSCLGGGRDERAPLTGGNTNTLGPRG